MWTYTYSNDISHSGIKGMKWGERRYQNKDGTLTPAGKKRYARESLESKHPKADASKWVREDISRSKRITDEVSGMGSKLNDLNRTVAKNRKPERMNLDNMTDKEMRDKINRELLERQYNDVFNSKNVSKGQERAQQVLNTTVAVLGVASSALGIALAIKELKG